MGKSGKVWSRVTGTCECLTERRVETIISFFFFPLLSSTLVQSFPLILIPEKVQGFRSGVRKKCSSRTEVALTGDELLRPESWSTYCVGVLHCDFHIRSLGFYILVNQCVHHVKVVSSRVTTDLFRVMVFVQLWISWIRLLNCVLISGDTLSQPSFRTFHLLELITLV